MPRTSRSTASGAAGAGQREPTAAGTSHTSTGTAAAGAQPRSPAHATAKKPTATTAARPAHASRQPRPSRSADHGRHEQQVGEEAAVVGPGGEAQQGVEAPGPRATPAAPIRARRPDGRGRDATHGRCSTSGHGGGDAAAPAPRARGAVEPADDGRADGEGQRHQHDHERRRPARTPTRRRSGARGRRRGRQWRGGRSRRSRDAGSAPARAPVGATASTGARPARRGQAGDRPGCRRPTAWRRRRPEPDQRPTAMALYGSAAAAYTSSPVSRARCGAERARQPPHAEVAEQDRAQEASVRSRPSSPRKTRPPRPSMATPTGTATAAPSPCAHQPDR